MNLKITDFKRNSSGRTRIYEYTPSPPPPPEVNALATALPISDSMSALRPVSTQENRHQIGLDFFHLVKLASKAHAWVEFCCDPMLVFLSAWKPAFMRVNAIVLYHNATACLSGLKDLTVFHLGY